MKILLINRGLYPRATAGMVMLRLADALKELGHEILFLVQEDMRNLDRPEDKVFTVSPTDTRGLTARTSRKYLQHDPGIFDVVTELVNNEAPDVALVFHVAGSLTWSVPAALFHRSVPVFMMETDFSRCCPTGRFCRPVSDPIGDFRRFFGHHAAKREEVSCMRCIKKLPLHSRRRRFPIRAVDRAVHGIHWCLLCRCADHDYYKSLDALRAERYLRRSKLIERPFGWMATSHHHAMLIDAAIKPLRPVRDVGLPLPLEAFVPTETKRGSYVLFIGTLSLRHGAEDLMDAISQMEGQPVHAIFAGDGPDRAMLQGQALEIVEKRGNLISFPGTLPTAALRRLIADSLAVVVPTRSEEIAPWPLLEAQALGKPVIASNCGVLPERVSGHVDGLIYTCGNVVELAKCLQEISQMSDEQYEALCAASKEKGQFYHPLNYAHRVLEFIEERTGMI